MRTYIGVDIGDYSIKCAVLKKVDGLYYIDKKKKYVIPKRGTKFDFAYWLKTVLSDFVKENKIRTASLCFSITCMPPRMTTRIFDMPQLPAKELERSMQYEIEEKTLVNDLNTVFYKWAIMEKKEDTYSIFMAIAERKLIRILKELKSITWRIAAIEPQVLSYGRLVSGNSVVIDFGHTGTRFIAYKDGKPLHYQSIDIGGMHLTQKIEKEYGDFFTPDESVRYQEAENMKHEKGKVLIGMEELEDDPISLKLSRILKGPVEMLAREIKQALRALEIQNEYVADKIYYVGEGARLKYLCQYVGKELGHTLEALGFDPANSPGMELEEEELQVLDDYPYMAASGASLCQEYPYLETVNFAHIKMPVQMDYKNLFVGVLCFSVLSQLMMWDIHKRTDKVLNRINEAIEEQQRSISALDSQINSQESRIQAFDSIQNEAESINQVARQKSAFPRTLEILANKTPEGVAVRHITMEGGVLIIDGVSKDYTNIGYFALALEELGEVNIDTINDLNEEETIRLGNNKAPKANKEFTITVNLNGVIY